MRAATYALLTAFALFAYILLTPPAPAREIVREVLIVQTVNVAHTVVTTATPSPLPTRPSPYPTRTPGPTATATMDPVTDAGVPVRGRYQAEGV